jgi:hypothetical protein
MKECDRSKSLQQLGWQDWGEAAYDSHIVTECHRLRRVPLGEFKVEDLRITIAQNLGLEYLVPLALEQLQEDPFAEGAYFPADLLVSVLGANGEFWQTHPDLREQWVILFRTKQTQNELFASGAATNTDSPVSFKVFANECLLFAVVKIGYAMRTFHSFHFLPEPTLRLCACHWALQVLPFAVR